MYLGFPLKLIPYLRCNLCRGELIVLNVKNKVEYINAGGLQCSLCGKNYEISDGIINFLDKTRLDYESSRESCLRDAQAKEYDSNFTPSTDYEKMEIIPTLAFLEPLKDQIILELGCGTGRYTKPIADKCNSLIAVDFSLESLRILSKKLTNDNMVGLVCSDVINFQTSDRIFSRIFCTLVSNLPTLNHRKAMYNLVKRSLTLKGFFIFSAHYYNLRCYLNRTAQSGYYRKGGIYRYIFKEPELIREIKEFFRKIQIRKIQIVLPFGHKIRLDNNFYLSLLVQNIKFLNEFASLILVKAIQ